jgi:hypothetical protein
MEVHAIISSCVKFRFALNGYDVHFIVGWRRISPWNFAKFESSQLAALTCQDLMSSILSIVTSNLPEINLGILKIDFILFT